MPATEGPALGRAFEAGGSEGVLEADALRRVAVDDLDQQFWQRFYRALYEQGELGQASGVVEIVARREA